MSRSTVSPSTTTHFVHVHSEQTEVVHLKTLILTKAPKLCSTPRNGMGRPSSSGTGASSSSWL